MSRAGITSYSTINSTNEYNRYAGSIEGRIPTGEPQGRAYQPSVSRQIARSYDRGSFQPNVEGDHVGHTIIDDAKRLGGEAARIGALGYAATGSWTPGFNNGSQHPQQGGQQGNYYAGPSNAGPSNPFPAAKQQVVRGKTTQFQGAQLWSAPPSTSVSGAAPATNPLRSAAQAGSKRPKSASGSYLSGGNMSRLNLDGNMDTK